MRKDRDQLEQKENSLWRLTLLLVVLLGTAAAISFWENLSTLGDKLPGAGALAAGVAVLMALFAAYVWIKKREIAELRGFIRGMQARSEGLPSEQQVERLLEVVARSQQGYRDLIDSFDDIVFTCSLEGELIAANRALAEVLDKDFSQLIGRRIDDFVDEPARGAVMKEIPRFLEKRHWQGVARVRLKSGGVRYLDCVLQAIVKEGLVTGVSCLARDVTQQRESEQRFKELFETLQEGVYFTTPEGKFLDANPTLVRMLGYDSLDELLGKNVKELYAHPATRDELLANLDRQGTVRNQEITLRKKDGSVLVCTDTSSAIRDSSGKVVRYQGALVDVTERRQIEKKLHEEQEFARRLVASFPDLIIVLDTEFRYTFVSPNITALLGFQPQELLGRVVGERSHPDDRGGMLQLAKAVLGGQSSYATLEYRTQHKDGSWRTFRASASPLYGPPLRASSASPGSPPAPQVRGLVASSRDVTDLKRLEQQVIQSEKLAAMGQMIAGVAHELNNPLTAIVGISDLLREQAPDGSSHRRQLELVNQQARRAADIVGNLLAFSRPATVQKGLVSLNDLLRRTLQLHEYTLRVNNIAVDFQPCPNLPPVLADANQLMQVFLNLIVNAEQAIRDHNAKLSSPRPGQLTVRLGTLNATADSASENPIRDGLESVWVTFQDNGPGIPPEVLPKIFDPFFTTKRPGRGTGLGLSICMALVREHGGNIEAVEAPGGGALFRIVLPRAPRPAGPAASSVQNAGAAPGTTVAAATQAAGPETSALAGRRVLVVDDEESIRELVDAGLSARGMHVTSAASGEEAIRLVERAWADSQPYDVVLCDVKMPGLSGDQFFARMRSTLASLATSRPEAPATVAKQMCAFIFMTGDVMESAVEDIVKEHGTRFVPKPFRISGLVPILMEALAEKASKPV